jgi:deazaflavin-dependent oxidoreductase (nitroreductase family)
MKWDAPYEPSTWGWVSTQVEHYEASGGTEANTLMDTGLPILVMWTIGHKSGKLRKVPLMTVEHEGEYAIIASKGGSPEHPGWYHNLIADPEIRIQDGAEPKDYRLEQLSGEERQLWFDRGVAAYPPYQEYQDKTDREIPVFVARPF